MNDFRCETYNEIIVQISEGIPVRYDAGSANKIIDALTTKA